MPRTDAEASVTAFCAASSQLFGDSVRTSITLIRAMMVPPESAWVACPMSSTVHEEARCAMIGYGRVICPDDRRTAQLVGQTSIRRAPTHFAQQRLAAGEERQLRLRGTDRSRGKRRRWNHEGGAPHHRFLSATFPGWGMAPEPSTVLTATTDASPKADR